MDMRDDNEQHQHFKNQVFGVEKEDHAEEKPIHQRRSSQVYPFSNSDLHQHAENEYYRNYAVNSFQDHLKFNLGQHTHPNMHIAHPETPEAHPEILEKRQRRSSNHSSESNHSRFSSLEIEENLELSKPIFTEPVAAAVTSSEPEFSVKAEKPFEFSFLSNLFKSSKR
jgi:hypothetical protein